MARLVSRTLSHQDLHPMFLLCDFSFDLTVAVKLYLAARSLFAREGRRIWHIDYSNVGPRRGFCALNSTTFRLFGQELSSNNTECSLFWTSLQRIFLVQ